MSAFRRTPPEGHTGWHRRLRSTHRISVLSPATAQRFERHIEWALARRPEWQAHLRMTVKVVVAELSLAGLSTSQVENVLRDAVFEHPSRASYDVVSLLSREPRSATILKLVTRWASGERAPRR